ncbi:dienelactone hydrolase [Pilimelia terevasa]|uniref:Dienelactone hydrolase n=1 Tax=Pilimelia terevasa TaxID=53372 RepID=A0A8J3BL31_9ACTN|nr:dienelactone hydrolase family protein [Pilimelia terevasa]GGK27067.1 dienelactone hydrolase [Pilimelia terevasa]
MTETLLFHHAQGRTPGLLAFADRWRAAGHAVHTPDLFDGATFDSVAEGVAHARSLGFDEIIRRGVATAQKLPARLVYAGFSLGALPAQALAQRRAGAAGALLLHSAVPTAEFGCPWPAGVPMQVHVMADDPWEDAQSLAGVVEEIDGGELFLYPGNGHLFADSGSADYAEEAATLLTERTLAFLGRVA